MAGVGVQAPPNDTRRPGRSNIRSIAAPESRVAQINNEVRLSAHVGDEIVSGTTVRPTERRQTTPNGRRLPRSVSPEAAGGCPQSWQMEPRWRWTPSAQRFRKSRHGRWLESVGARHFVGLAYKLLLGGLESSHSPKIMPPRRRRVADRRTQVDRFCFGLQGGRQDGYVGGLGARTAVDCRRA